MPEILKIEPKELKPLCDWHDLDGIVLLAVRDTPTGVRYRIVSWGRGRTQCKRFARIGEDFGKAIEAGHIDLEE